MFIKKKQENYTEYASKMEHIPIGTQSVPYCVHTCSDRKKMPSETFVKQLNVFNYDRNNNNTFQLSLDKIKFFHRPSKNIFRTSKNYKVVSLATTVARR